LIESIVSDVEQDVLSKVPVDPKKRLKKVRNIRKCLNSLKNTNSFMLMTINRCIDYTKIHKGIKLMPRCETVTLLDCLKMPLECMKNIQEKIAIVLNPISSDVCSHIITDKQWLQENLLCLLSNAVKYSSEGTVAISVSVAEKQMVEACSINRMVGETNIEIAATTEPSKAEEGKEDEKKDQEASSEESKYAPLESIKTLEIPNELAKIGQPDLSRTEDEYYLRVDVEDMGIGKVAIAIG